MNFFGGNFLGGLLQPLALPLQRRNFVKQTTKTVRQLVKWLFGSFHASYKMSPFRWCAI